MRLLLVGDSPAIMSGQARMVRELAYRFVTDGVQVTVAGWFHFAATKPFSAPYEIIPAIKEQPERLTPILDAVKPDAVLAIGDPWEFAWLAAQRPSAPWLLYGYLNGEFAENPPHCEVVYDGFDAFRLTSAAGAAAVGRGATYVHLGVDTRLFQPGPKPARLLGREITPEHQVIFVNAQNRPRKHLPGCIAAISEFASQTDIPILAIFNCMPQDPGGSNLAVEMVRFDADDLVVFNTANLGPNRTVDDEGIAQFYEAADLYLVMSSSEGFCLPVLEAMASRTLVVAPNSYSMPELLDPRGEVGVLIERHGWAQADRGVLYHPGAQVLSGLGGWTRIPDVSAAAQGLAIASALLRDGQAKPLLDAAQAFAEDCSWNKTYQGIAEMIAPATRAPRWPIPGARVADGGQIDPLLRWRARQRAQDRIGVVKIGGLGDMLMATRVIHEARQRWNRDVTVFCNTYHEVFEALEGVEDVIQIRAAESATVVRSVADEFEVFLDLRLPARAYGPLAPPAPLLATKYAWMTDYGVFAYGRLAHLHRHATQIMLESLDLPFHDLTPIYTPRAELSTPDDRLKVAESIVIAPGVGQLGQLKQPDFLWWKTLIDQAGRRVIQAGSFDDPLIDGCTDARGWGLPVTATLIETAYQCVMVESGLAHLARAVRAPGARPTVVLFGPSPVNAYAYPEHTNLYHEFCQPCFFGPLWHDQRCAIGEPTCINLPNVRAVLRTLQ